MLPAAIRAAAHRVEDSVLIARTDGHERIILETEEAIRQRIWDAAPAASDSDVTADIRDMRDDDLRLADEHAARRAAAGSKDSDAVGAALLAHLGL